MNRTVPRLLWKSALLALLPLLAWFASAARADQVELVDAKPVAGKIEAETATEVRVRTSSGTETIAVNRISAVQYEGQGGAMTQAKAFERAGNLRGAAEQFAKAQQELRDKDKPFLFAAAEFGEARTRATVALADSSGIDQAIARLDAFRRDHEDSRHRDALHELLGRLYLAGQDYAKAQAAFDELGRAPWPEGKLRAQVYQGRILLAQNQPAAARERFDEVLAAPAASPAEERAQLEALVETAASFRMENNSEREIELLERVIDRAAGHGTSLEARAYADLGDALRTAHRTKHALLAYLHVDLLFAGDKEVHARALYNLTELWSELGFADRAAAARSALTSRYPNSPWAKKLASRSE